tara:strand:+ start:807 stop:1445 length:639 start_codon:yes stop_codon:yes gene_type:complete
MTAKIKLNAASGGGSISIQAPSSSSNNRVISLPDIADGTLVTSQSTLDATKLSGALPAISGAALTNLPGGGKILQVISQESTTGFATTSSSFVDVFDFTADITPSATSSKVLVMASSNMECDGSNNRSFATIRRDSTNLGHSSGGLTQMHEYYYPGAQDQEMPCTMIYLDSPNTTSQVTYKVQIRLSGGTRAGWNGAQTQTKGSFIVMEVAA